MIYTRHTSAKMFSSVSDLQYMLDNKKMIKATYDSSASMGSINANIEADPKRPLKSDIVQNFLRIANGNNRLNISIRDIKHIQPFNKMEQAAEVTAADVLELELKNGGIARLVFM